MAAITLYHFPPSFYSQIVRIVLAEKGINYESVMVAPAPPNYENYEPWYMKLNPGGTVPTLVHNDVCLPDSAEIIRYVDQTFSEPRLLPSDEATLTATEYWLSKLATLSIRELSYGSPMAITLGTKINNLRIKNLGKRALENPDMVEIYRNKQEDMRQFSANANNPDHMAQLGNRLTDILDELEQSLQKSTWLAGKDYTMADACWTVAIARFKMIHLNPLLERPSLSEWYQRVKSRSSFDQVWEKPKPGEMLPVLIQKLWRQLLVISISICVLIYGLVFLFR